MVKKLPDIAPGSTIILRRRIPVFNHRKRLRLAHQHIIESVNHDFDITTFLFADIINRKIHKTPLPYQQLIPVAKYRRT